MDILREANEHSYTSPPVRVRGEEDYEFSAPPESRCDPEAGARTPRPAADTAPPFAASRTPGRICCAVALLTDGAALLAAAALTTHGADAFAAPPAIGRLLLFAGALTLALRAADGLYPGYRLNPEERIRRRVLTALVAGLTAAGASLLFTEAGPAGPLAIALFLAVGGLLHLGLDALARRALHRAGLWGVPVAILAAPRHRAEVEAFLRTNWQYGLVPAGDPEGAGCGTLLVAAETLPAGAALAALRARFAELIVLSDLPRLRLSGLQPVDLKAEIGLRLAGSSGLGYPGKRALDLAIAVPALVFLSPLILLAGLAIRLADPGPVFYRQTREGLAGRPIRVWKLRTMYRDAETVLQDLLARDPAARAEWASHFKLRRDPRILPVVGHALRASSFDELPQLFNVIAGEMSIVGPRPFPDYHLRAMRPEFRRKRSSILPGITGLWQVSGRSEVDVSMQENLDEFYIDNRSFWLDFSIIIKTMGVILGSRGAY